MAPNCKTCGIVKTTDNCGLKTVNGKQYWQTHCKSCISAMISIKKNANGRFEWVIYCFRDTGLTITYIGQTGNYHRRMSAHRQLGTIHPNEVAYILQTNETITKEEGAAWCKEWENYYMNLHKDTIRNKNASGAYVRPLSVHSRPDPPSASSDSDDSN